jgi:NitT/TauT family transport system ATP-binding protein
MAAPCSLGLGGNAITVSSAVWRLMVGHGAALGADPSVQGGALRSLVLERRRAGEEPLTFAMVYPFSCHNYELRYWLAACGVAPESDVRLVVMPPPLLVDALREGHIDGFCVGEPWNSLAVSLGVGVIAASTTSIWRLSPEKVLGCRLEWLEARPERAAALVRALHGAASWCEDPRHHAELSRLLSAPRYVGAPAELLARGLSNRLPFAQDESPRVAPDFYTPARYAAGYPWRSHAVWFYSQMVRWGQVRFSAQHLPAVSAVYRPDVYRAALEPLGVNLPLAAFKVEGARGGAAWLPGDRGAVDYGADGFFDNQPFDPERFEEYVARQIRTAAARPVLVRN